MTATLADWLGAEERPDWANAEAWPPELRQLFEYAALMALLAIRDQDAKMLDVQIEGTDEPVTMLFAIGDRAEELRRAWLSVRALHNPSDRAKA